MKYVSLALRRRQYGAGLSTNRTAFSRNPKDVGRRSWLAITLPSRIAFFSGVRIFSGGVCLTHQDRVSSQRHQVTYRFFSDVRKFSGGVYLTHQDRVQALQLS